MNGQTMDLAPISIDNMFGQMNLLQKGRQIILTPEERQMYEQILAEGGETTPTQVHMFYPDKEKATLRMPPEPSIAMNRKKRVKKGKVKRKTKGCGCK